MAEEFQVTGKNPLAKFTLKVHRGDGMALLAMNWKKEPLPDSFVGFAIEYKEPDGDRFYALKNRLTFAGANKKSDPNRLSTLRAPIQKFRWVHFPRNANLPGEFTYRVTPVFMNDKDELSYGESQQVQLELRRETYPGKLNVTFTRGFVSSQAFVDNYERYGPISELLPDNAKDGLNYIPTHPKAEEALKWMGFEAREAILDVLDQAIADAGAQVCVVAYDLNDPAIVARLTQLGPRLKIIIDDSGGHKKAGSAENQAEAALASTAGNGNVKRQHMRKLQHNKTIVVDGPSAKLAVCGSTNFSWRGLFVQNNNAIVLMGKKAIKPFLTAFDNYWNSSKAADFADTASAKWTSLGLEGISAKVAFSPHSESNAVLQAIADDIEEAKSSLFYSLAFLSQTPGAIKEAIKKVTNKNDRFVYGISDKKAGGIVLQKPDGNLAPVYASALSKDVPEPFKSEPSGGGGIRMHNKFVVVDFDKPGARVYLGSYNFSSAADADNGENLLLIRDRRIVLSYLIEALCIFDHYHFRVRQQEAKKNAAKKLELAKPPRNPGEEAWWKEYYTDPRKIRDRELFD